MRKLIATINMTLDGFCNHDSVTADQETHQHYAELLSNAGAIIWGRITYQLMESYWPEVIKTPTGNKQTDAFAAIVHRIPKVVFSHTLNNVGWENVTLAKGDIEEEVTALKQQPGKDILVGSPSLIISLMKLGLIDEYQFCVHPVIAASGLPLFKNISDRTMFKLLKTKVFGGGAIILYYEPIVEQ